MYESRYLEQVLQSALCDDAHGPLDVWLWLAGALTPESLAKINKTATEPGGAKDYTTLLHAYVAIHDCDLSAMCPKLLANYNHQIVWMFLARRYSKHNKNGTDLCSSQ